MDKIFAHVSPLVDAPETLDAAVNVLYTLSLIPELVPSIRFRHLSHLIRLWSSPRYTNIHQQVAHILHRIRGRDSFILYTTTTMTQTQQQSPAAVTPLHDHLLTGGVVRFTMARHDVWCVPIDMGPRAPRVFTSRDPIDAIITFPPTLGFPSTILPRRCAGLAFPTSRNSVDDNLLSSLVRAERQGEWEFDHPSHGDATATYLQETAEQMGSIAGDGDSGDGVDTDGKMSRLWVLGFVDDFNGRDIKDATRRFAGNLSSYFSKSVDRFHPSSGHVLPTGPPIAPPALIGADSKFYLVVWYAKSCNN